MADATSVEDIACALTYECSADVVALMAGSTTTK